MEDVDKYGFISVR